jgi:pimeloyl-ACP methyl ester carboxylesterase
MRILALLVALVCIASPHLTDAEDQTAKAKSDAPFPGKKSQWSGFDQYSLPCDGKSATIVVPKEPAPGKPWLWRGEFFGAFPSVDLALLAKGWHVVYLNGCSNTFGSPDSMEHWAALYKTLTTEYGFSKKPVMYGMSRGGLYVYNWAAAHPDSVGMIYGDAPVCDIHSWPGGKGKGKGSAGDWKAFMQVFHLKTEQEAIEWKQYNPIDILAPIAKAKIPIIHVVGDADDVVPMDENTTVIKTRYEKLGGHVELIVKHGVGHHPHSLADPTPIVDYILKNRIGDND